MSARTRFASSSQPGAWPGSRSCIENEFSWGLENSSNGAAPFRPILSRPHGVRHEIVVTSPGRQAANADELVKALARIRRATVRVLEAEEEAGFAYRGVL